MNQLKSVTSHSQLQQRSNPGLFCEDKVHKKQVLSCFFSPNLSCLGEMSAACGCRSQECVESQSGGATFCSASQLWNLSFQGKRGGNKKKSKFASVWVLSIAKRFGKELHPCRSTPFRPGSNTTISGVLRYRVSSSSLRSAPICLLVARDQDVHRYTAGTDWRAHLSRCTGSENVEWHQKWI